MKRGAFRVILLVNRTRVCLYEFQGDLVRTFGEHLVNGLSGSGKH